jgi:hypothetical protein
MKMRITWSSTSLPAWLSILAVACRGALLMPCARPGLDSTSNWRIALIGKPAAVSFWLAVAALRHLQFREGTVVYLCLLDGRLQQERVVVSAPVLKVRYDQEHSVDVDDEGKDALTHFHLLQAYADASYVEAEIFTGRTHQIRVQPPISPPLAGDNRYQARTAKMEGAGLEQAVPGRTI